MPGSTYHINSNICLFNIPVNQTTSAVIFMEGLYANRPYVKFIPKLIYYSCLQLNTLYGKGLSQFKDKN
jgi:hypothetical protein